MSQNGESYISLNLIEIHRKIIRVVHTVIDDS